MPARARYPPSERPYRYRVSTYVLFAVWSPSQS